MRFPSNESPRVLAAMAARRALPVALGPGEPSAGNPRSLRRDDRGFATVFFAVAIMPFILALLAIVAEVGFVMATRSDLQRTADAGALAGALQVLENPINAEVQAETTAAANYADLVTNEVTIAGNHVTSLVHANADSLFPAGSWLSFGEPLIQAEATARAAAPRLPGPGVFCVGVELTTQQDAQAAQEFWGSPLEQAWAGLAPLFLTQLRSGAGAGSNAGFIDIGGPVNQNTRDCLSDGSANPVQPVEETQTGLSTGQARQGLQARLEAARDRNCFTWGEIVASIQAADSDGDGVADDGSWRCDPLSDQATAVVFIPIVDQDFTDQQGTMTITVHDLGADSTYQFAMYWIDALRTFEDIGANNWQFVTSGGQGHAEVVGVFLLDRPTVIMPPPPTGSTGGFVDCDPTAAGHCFVQLVD